MIAETLADTSARMDRAVEAAKDDFATVRTGRANPQPVSYTHLTLPTIYSV